MATLNGFDANQVDPMEDRGVIPAGQYLAIIEASEIKPTKAGTGSYLMFTFQIIEGKYKGRKQWARLNLDNPNQQAVDIARSELSSICRAVGVMTPGDSGDLHDLPLMIKVAVEKRSDNGEPSNVIKGYADKSKKGDAPAAEEKADDKTPPWKK